MKYKKAVLVALQQVLGAAAGQGVFLIMVLLGQLVLAAVAVLQEMTQMLERAVLEELVEAVEAVVELHLTGLTLAQALLVVQVLFVFIHGDPNDK
jgi:hypothetical protein